MESNIKKIEKDLDVLTKKLDSLESELDNIEMKVSIIKEMQKDEGLKHSKEVETELQKVIDRLQKLMISSGLYSNK